MRNEIYKVYLKYKMSKRAIWEFVKYIFEKLKNEASSYRAENYVHAVYNMGIKQANTIATVNYRYGKIGACYTKRHKPSLSWTISN